MHYGYADFERSTQRTSRGGVPSPCRRYHALDIHAMAIYHIKNGLGDDARPKSYRVVSKYFGFRKYYTSDTKRLSKPSFYTGSTQQNINPPLRTLRSYCNVATFLRSTL